MLFKYIEEKCSSYFLSMQCTNRCPLNIVALQDSQKIMVIRWHLWVHRMRRKWLKQFFSVYLYQDTQPPSEQRIFVINAGFPLQIRGKFSKQGPKRQKPWPIQKFMRSHEKIVKNSWESCNKVKRKSWTRHEKVIRNSIEIHEKFMRKSWEIHEKLIGKSCENWEKFMRKPWKSY